MGHIFKQRIRNKRRWEKVRRYVLDRDGWKCRECGKVGRLEIDHVIPLSQLPEDDPERWYDTGNLQTLCRKCHKAKTLKEIGIAAKTQGLVAWDQLVHELNISPSV